MRMKKDDSSDEEDEGEGGEDTKTTTSTRTKTATTTKTTTTSRAATTENQFSNLTTTTRIATTNTALSSTREMTTMSHSTNSVVPTSLPAVITNIAAQTSVKASVVVLPIFFGVVILAIVLSFIFRSKIQRMWKQCFIQRIKRRAPTSDKETFTGGSNSVNSVFSAEYSSVVEKEVIVSSLPADMSTQHKPTTVDESYSVLNRENNTKCNITNTFDNSSQYDLLDHTNRPSLSSNYDNNVYSSANLASCRNMEQGDYSTANPGGVYSSSNPGGVYSSANPGDVYSSANPGGVYSSANPGGVYSSANPGNVYNSANQTNVYSEVDHGNNSSANENNAYSIIENTK